MTRFLLFGTLALGCSLAFTAQAYPRPGDVPRTQAVTTSDLNLDSEAGADAAVSRIFYAARTVCDENLDSVRDLRAWAEFRRCRRHATETAVASLGAPLVTAAYADRRGRPGAATGTATYAVDRPK